MLFKIIGIIEVMILTGAVLLCVALPVPPRDRGLDVEN